MKDMRIVVVEDDEDLRSLFAEVLAELGAVVGFGDVYQALAQLRYEPCDLLVLDHLLPGATGVALVERLRRDGIDVPIVVVSGMVSPPLVESLRELGVQAVLAKPVTPEKLLAAAVDASTEHAAAGRRTRPTSHPSASSPASSVGRAGPM